MPNIIPLRKFIDNEGYIKAIIKGEPDTRKTSALASWPGKKLWIAQDRKMRSLIVPINRGLADDNIDVFVPTRSKDILKLLDKLIDLHDNIEYSAVIVDSFTSVIEVELRRLAHGKANASAISGPRIIGSRKQPDASGRSIGGIPINTMEDYKAETALVMDMIDKVQRIRCHFFLICHVVAWQIENMQGKKTGRRQLFTGGKKATSLLPTQFPEIWHFQKEDSYSPDEASTYKVLFRSTDEELARTTLDIPRGEIDWTDKSFYETVSPYLDLRLKPHDQIKPIKPSQTKPVE